jgi:anti-sigma-K factor RskA
MYRDECVPFRENIPAYVLGSLDLEDAVALNIHLQTCKECQDELAAYNAVSEGLLMATPPQNPSAGLRKQLQARLPSAQKVLRPSWTWSFNQVALVVTVIFLLVLNLYSFIQIQSLQRQQAQLARQINTGQAALAMLSYSDTQTIPITGTNIAGTFLLDRDRNVAVLIVWNLPSLKSDQTYQIWLIDPQGKRTSGGLFRPEADQPFTSVAVFSGQNLSNFRGIGVTVEPAAGSNQPTGARIFKVDF